MLSPRITFLAWLVSVAVASPVSSVQASQVNKRATEGIHLVNCGNSYSTVVYCPDDGNCNQQPSSDNIFRFGGINHWEGQTKTVQFSTGVGFTYNIDPNAQDKPDFDPVGTGSNSFHSYTIRKDNKHTMYFDEGGLSCASIYYALQS